MKEGKESPMTPEHTPASVNHVTVIDMDRTLIDTDRMVTLVYSAIADVLGDAVAAELRHAEESQRGASFSITTGLRTLLEGRGKGSVAMADETMASIKHHMLKSAKPFRELSHDNGGLLEPGARELIAAIPRSERFILTYGESEEWQRWKLEAAGLSDEPYTILLPSEDATAEDREQPKIDFLKRHFDANADMFVFKNIHGVHEPLHTRTLTIIDDKKKHLESRSSKDDIVCLSRIECFWYAPHHQVELTHPTNVRIVRKLGELLRHLNAKHQQKT